MCHLDGLFCDHGRRHSSVGGVAEDLPMEVC